jgi:hypothetical protein
LKYKESATSNIDDVVERLEIELKSKGIIYKKRMALPLKEKELLQQMKVLETSSPSSQDYQDIIQYFTEVTKGLVSYYYYNDPNLFPELDQLKIEKVQLSNEQFAYYEEGRKLEFDEENPIEPMFGKRKIDKKMFDNIVFKKPKKGFSMFKLYSRISSNFVFPGIRKARNGKQIDGERFFKEAGERGFLDVQALNKYSPKIKKLLENLESAKGPSLIYSQYRVIEGLGAVSAVLEHNGYSEVNIRKVNGEFKIQTDKEAAKHFIIFSNTDQQRMQILMDIFNKNWTNLPKHIVAEAKKIDIDVIMITQAGSEGISLKGVRQVHMLEPYWNYVRVSQVIGRTARAKSHSHLPIEDQNVKLYMYLSTLSDEQKKIMSWDDGRLSKLGMSSDEMIFDIAKRKDKMLQILLSIMKHTAMDCKIHLKKHLKIDPEMKCIE